MGMYTVTTAADSVSFDTFNLAWAYSQQLGQAFTITFAPRLCEV